VSLELPQRDPEQKLILYREFSNLAQDHEF